MKNLKPKTKYENFVKQRSSSHQRSSSPWSEEYGEPRPSNQGSYTATNKKLKCSPGNKQCGNVCVPERYQCRRDAQGNFLAVPIEVKNSQPSNQRGSSDREHQSSIKKENPKNKESAILKHILPIATVGGLGLIGLAIMAGGSKNTELIKKSGQELDAEVGLAPGTSIIRDQMLAQIDSKAGIDDDQTTRDRMDAIDLELPDDLEQVKKYTFERGRAYNLLQKLSVDRLTDRDKEDFQDIFGMSHEAYPEYYRQEKARLTADIRRFRNGELNTAPKARLMGNGSFAETAAKVGPAVLANIEPENVFLRREMRRRLHAEESRVIGFVDGSFNYNSPRYNSVVALSEQDALEKARHDAAVAEFERALEENPNDNTSVIVTQERWKNLTSYVQEARNGSISNILFVYGKGYSQRNYERLEASIEADRAKLAELEPVRRQVMETWQTEFYAKKDQLTPDQQKDNNLIIDIRDKAFAKVKAIDKYDDFQRTINEHRAKTELMAACVVDMYDRLDLPQNNNVVDAIERKRESLWRDSSVSLVNFANDTEKLLKNRDSLIFYFMMDNGGPDGGGAGHVLFQDEPFQDYDHDTRIDKKKLFNRLAGEIEKVTDQPVSREEIAQQRRIWADLQANAIYGDGRRMREFLLNDIKDRTGIDLGQPKFTQSGSSDERIPDNVITPEYDLAPRVYDSLTWKRAENYVRNTQPELDTSSENFNASVRAYLESLGPDTSVFVTEPNPDAKINDPKWRQSLIAGLKEIGVETPENLSNEQLIDSILDTYKNVVNERAIKGSPIFYEKPAKFYQDGLSERALNINPDKGKSDHSYDGIEYSPGKLSFTKSERERINARKTIVAAKNRISHLEPEQIDQLNKLLAAVRSTKEPPYKKASRITAAYNKMNPSGPTLDQVMAAWLISSQRELTFGEGSGNCLLEFSCAYPNSDGYPISNSVEDFLVDAEMLMIYSTNDGDIRSLTLKDGQVDDIELFTESN